MLSFCWFIAILQSCPNSFNSLFMSFKSTEVKQFLSKVQTRPAKGTEWARRETEKVGIPPSFFICPLCFLHLVNLTESFLAKVYGSFVLSALHCTGVYLHSSTNRLSYLYSFRVKAFSWPECKVWSTSRPVPRLIQVCFYKISKLSITFKC